MRKLLFLFSLLFVAFTLNAQTITVTSPNGSEVWAGCTVKNITWTASGTSGFFSVDYSTDGGTNWTSLATNLNATTYSWTVPNTFSSNCLVRVFDFNTPAVSDQSNATFTITAPLILTSPNGGESWQVGGPTRNITWVANGTGTLLTLEYSTDMGATWNNITSSANAASNLYVWTLPNNPSPNCLLRVRDNANSCMSDVSDNLFTIAPPTHNITVTSPNTATTWYVFEQNTITWTSAYLASPNVMIEYSINNGTSWNTIVAATPNTGNYAWTVPNTPSTQALIRVSEGGLPSVNDVSNVNFTISSPVINVTSPNTAMTLYRGNTHTIQWSSTTLSGNFVKLEYSTDNGANWITIITATSNTGSYNWTIPNTPSSNCLIRVSDANTPSTFDVSNNNFTIANPIIAITSPNGGEIWNGCSSQTITWTRTGTNTNARIYYSIDGGATWNTIISSYNPGSGVTNCSYTWTNVPNTPSTNCLVQVTDLNGYAVDQSNAPFTISPNTSIVVTSPNGGETLAAGGANHAITWTATGTSTTLTIQYSIDNGTNWTNITTAANTASGTYSWTIPNSPSTQCLIRIVDASNTCKSDVSNATFTITSALPYITVYSPNPGSTVYIGNTVNIAWNSGYLVSPLVAIDYSTDNGATWTSITSAVNNAGSYSWVVPNLPSTQALIRVSEYNNPGVSDVTDAPFTIRAPYLRITSPNLGTESWNGCSSQVITWNRFGTVNNAKIEYSIDGGTNWTTIINSVAGTSYTWNPVANLPSTNCLIRVTDVNLPTATDVSDVPFTITQNTAIILTSPNGGEVWQVGGPARYITWAATGTSTNLTIQYSTNNGASWTNITTTANAASSLYLWTIPNTPSTQCLIRIVDASNTCKSDVSEMPFTIEPPAHVINVTAPNTATTWYVFEQYNITWTSLYLPSTVVIEYSIDNGFNWTTISSSAANNGSYAWTVPNTPSTSALIRISEFGNPAVNDVSDVNFTISSPRITVTTPNTGLTWYRGQTQTIYWSNTILSGPNVKIEYSTDNGANWATIIASTPNTNSYNWVIPNTPSPGKY